MSDATPASAATPPAASPAPAKASAHPATSLPSWADELTRAYLAGAASVFLLHGNLHDLVVAPPGRGSGEPRFLGLEEFLAGELFGSRDLVLQYDRGAGLVLLAGDDRERRQEMRAELQRTLSAIDLVAGSSWSSALPKEPRQVLDLLDRLLLSLVYETPDAAGDRRGRRRSLAVVLRYTETLAPATDVAWLSGEIGALVVKLLNWANDPAIRRADVTIVLLCENLADLNPRLVQHPFVNKIEVPLPSTAERRSWIEHLLRSPADGVARTAGSAAAASAASTAPETAAVAAPENGEPAVDPAVVAAEANGLTLVGVGQVVARARRGGDGFDPKYLKQAKKELIEKECFGLVEFVSPRYDLSMLVAQPAVKRRLEEDARLIREGRWSALPMGYLLCGVLGTGKTFTSTCFAGTIGIPALIFKNLREKWVGSSEGNLQKVLQVVRALGPVVVVVDEADAALGKRSAEGDSGTSSRMFAMIAAQMADTSYRGRILWMLLTARPDMLTVDLKRQGRAEVHIPLFPPQTEDERREMVRVLARKNGVELDAQGLQSLQAIPAGLSGADLESVVVQAIRAAALRGLDRPTPEIVGEALARFVSPSYSVEKELQELVAIRETTDLEFLPEGKRELVTDGERAAWLDRRVAELKALLRE